MASHKYEQGYEDDRFQTAVGQNFHCAICLNVLKDPVMCQRNQHCFCRPCVTRHLRISQTCPTCMEELTVETLTEVPRIFRVCLSEFNVGCDYFNRGCREIVQLGDLETHVKNCGFRPVMCSNQGCLVEINKRDQTHHETEVCELRKVKCHNCGKLTKEIDDIKMSVLTLTENFNTMKTNQTTANKEMKMKLTAVTNGMDEVRMNLKELKQQLATRVRETIPNIRAEKVEAVQDLKQAEPESKQEKLNGLVIGGGFSAFRENPSDSAELYCLSSKVCLPLQPMKERRQGASSFVFGNQIIVTGGFTGNGRTDTMERVTINPVIDREQWFDFPAKLPRKMNGHSSVVYDERLIIIGGRFDGNEFSENIHEVRLAPPYTSKLLTRMPQTRFYLGAQLFHDKILICGGKLTNRNSDALDSVLIYDITKNECKQISPLPYVVCEMATVSWGDNVIVIGGSDKNGIALNTVVIYNVKTEKSHMLPAMNHKRKACAAVVVDNTIIVIGGRDEKGNYLNTVESFSFERYSWENLPPMNESRYLAYVVAC